MINGKLKLIVSLLQQRIVDGSINKINSIPPVTAIKVPPVKAAAAMTPPRFILSRVVSGIMFLSSSVHSFLTKSIREKEIIISMASYRRTVHGC